MKATQQATLRREEACAVCAVKDWLENRYPVYLFKEATGTTTWYKHFYVLEGEDVHDEQDDEEPKASGGKRPAGTLLIEDSGAFCFGPKNRTHEILDVQRYAAEWPLIPIVELHASSVQHPDDLSMRWLLHCRRVKCLPASDVPQLAGQDALPKSAGVGDKEESVWCCKLCVENLCQENPKMPPLALANAFFGGRHHPLFREATLGTRMLASSGRLIMRQLFLGRGAQDEVHKGMTGNTMLIAQPAPTYEQVLPNRSALTEGLVVLFCKSIDDVARAQMLVVDREQYRAMVQHRQQVCPTFAKITLDHDAMDQLPSGTVPDFVLQNAQAMPEAAHVRTTMHGPANRIPMFSRQEGQNSDADTSADEQGEGDMDANKDGVDSHHADMPDEPVDLPAESSNELPAESLIEHETVIGVDEESCPKPLRLFEAWNAGLAKLNAEAAKFAQAELQQRAGENSASAVVKQVAAKELVRTSVAVDLIDVARRMTSSSKACAELQSLAAAQSENVGQPPQQALAVPTGKPLSIFDPSALPAACTEFLFGDCVPFLKRVTPVTAQQVFDALPSREELEYSLEDDEEPYRASDRSRYDNPEFYAVFASFLRLLKLLQSAKGSMDREGFEKDFKIIASATSEDFVKAALHPSQPRSNEDLLRTAGNEKVRTALRHLTFSTATVPLTDGNKMRLHHFGCAMNQIFAPLTVFHTHNYADNYSPEILRLQSSEPPAQGYMQNIVMPTLQQMHQKTAASPRSTAKLFLLMEELSYRHLYRVDPAHLGNFKLQSPLGYSDKEDDFASNCLRGLADFVTALFKCIEAQARGFAHGHGKVHSIPDGTKGLLQCLEDVKREIEMLQHSSGGAHPVGDGTGGGVHPAEEVVESIVPASMDSYNQRFIASASTRQYESAILPAKQLGQVVSDSPFSEKQQRQSRYDGGVEEDGTTIRPLVPVVAAEPLAHIAQERRRQNYEHQQPGNDYKELPMTGCQLCLAPHYLLPHSFGQECVLGDEGEVDSSDVSQLAGLPWVFNAQTGELQHFLTDLAGNVATPTDFEQDAVIFEKCFGLDVRFLHNHAHDHDCSGTCVKNMKKKTLEEITKMLKRNRAPPCRFEFFHIVCLQLEERTMKIRRRGKEIVDTPHILSTTSRNQFGSVALERPQPFRSASSDCSLSTLRCNNDYKYVPKGFADASALSQSFRCDLAQLAACFRTMKAHLRPPAILETICPLQLFWKPFVFLHFFGNHLSPPSYFGNHLSPNFFGNHLSPTALLETI